MKGFNNTLLFVLFLALLGGVYYLGYISNRQREINVENVVRIDIIDTLRLTTNITFKEEKFVEFMPYVIKDTFRVNDTLYVNIPRTQKEYADSSYRVWVSGYKPALDSIEIYQRNTYVEKHIVRERNWFLGAGVGVSLGQHGLQPTLQVGFYRAIRLKK